MSKPKVAIITRTKDRPLFLKRAIQSVLRQSFADWVHVIVNDGGERESVDLLVTANKEAYAGRVEVVHHAKSQGMQNASNAGLAASDSTYVVIHDDDDSWYADFLEKTVGFLEDKGADSAYQGVATQTTQILEEVCLTGEIEELRRRPYYPFAFVNLGELRTRNIFAPIAFLYRRAVHEKIGLFRQEFDVLGDHDFNLRFVRQFEIGVIPTFHAFYHWRHISHGNTVTRYRESHRRMLNRMKNAYYRDSLENPATSVGSLEGIEFPPPESPDVIPFRLRTEEAGPREAFPDFLEDYDFKVVSLDVFDTVLLRRCHRPRDVFKFLEARAVADLGLPRKPYALAREEAELLARRKHGREITHGEIYEVLGSLCALSGDQSSALAELEIRIEKETLYADPRWKAFCETCRERKIHLIFTSDMYLSSETIRDLLSHCGIPDAEVHVSCERSGSKHEGTLQSIIAEKLGLDPGRIFHVGDNFHSDCLRSWQAGWQAFHWSQDFHYKPWFAQVEPHQHHEGDLLSPRLIGEVQRLANRDDIDHDDLYQKLGREVAGPLYLSFLLWVLEQARRDGIRKLMLVGRDGYYWEKTLDLLGKRGDAGVEFTYVHSSRKVFNFASFDELNADAIRFLQTPNPSLRVRDFIDRTGLKATRYIGLMKHVGFDDPEEVLTNETGGRFLESRFAHQLHDLFQLLKPELEAMFEMDREGVLQVLDDAGYDPADCAFVDIGWNASCVRNMARLLSVKAPDRVRGYYFGTWKEARPDKVAAEVKSFFMHYGEPQEHFLLTRESINWIESLHSAPFPTLVAFRRKEGRMEPQFADSLKSGFSLDQQGRIWEGARMLIEAVTENGLPLTGKYSGFSYINLVLHRLLREPSPREVAEWSGIQHSEGFGLEVYKHLVEPVSEGISGQDLLTAYRASNWKRGFLSTLGETQRQFVIDRTLPRQPRTAEELQADLEHKVRELDKLWGERERYRWMAENAQENVQRLQEDRHQLSDRISSLSGAIESIQKDKRVADEAIASLGEEVRKHKSYIESLQKEKATLDKLLKEQSEIRAGLAGQRDELMDQKASLDARIAGLEKDKGHLVMEKDSLGNQLSATEAERASLEARLTQLKKSRAQAFKLFLTQKLPKG